MEQKKNKLLSDMIQNDTDKKMVQLVEAATDLSCGDICTLLEVAHSLPFVGNLEGGDTYINVLTREKESMVIAQYRHPNYDLYKRSIIGEIERREDEPAVYRALEEGISGRGLIGIIDEGRTVVRHTVSPILNSEKKVIGALTYEYPNASADTESIRIINNQEGKQDPFNRQLGKASDYLQDAILLYDANGICTFVNPKAEVLYQDKGFELPLIGRRCSELHITDCNWSDLTEHRGVIRREVRTPNFIMDAVISGIWENGTCQGAAIIFRDKTVVHQMEDEIAYRVALIHEVHHRVKNNLQTIISLIGLEAVHTKDEKVKAFAKTITSHVRSMNITYDLLSHTGSENVGLKVLISRITDVLLENNCLKETCSISTRVDGDDVILTETTASTVALIGYCALSLQNVEIAGKIQLYMLMFAIAGCIVATVAFLFSGVWSFDNFKNFFYSQVGSHFGIPSWIIGMALLITPFFGFETVPQMVEEGDFPIKDSNKAILGSIVSCGIVYSLFFFGLGGMPVQPLVEEGGAAVNGFLAITMMEQLGGGWGVFAVIFGIAAILCAIGTCLLGFWLSTVRLMYAMGENNFLPKAFTKLNSHQQPVLPNILLLIISLVFLLLQNATTFMNDFFNLMSFGCACAYALTMISAMRIHKKYPNWVSPYKLKGGNFTRVLALIIAVVIAFFCTLGQSAGSWKSFGIYLGVGVLLWLWMVLVNWKKHPVEIETVEGLKKF